MGLFELARFAAVNALRLLIAYAVLLFGYRLTLHPLNRYPGPFFAKILDGYGGLYAAARRLHLVTYENHVKYGRVVRQGPDRLVFNTAEALHDIYQNPRVIKSSLYNLAQMSPHHNIFDTVDVETHKRKRKIISQALTEKSMRTFEPVMSEQVDIFIQQLNISSKKSEDVDMTERCMWLGGDIVGQLAFGYELKQQTNDANRWLQPGLALASARINVYMQAPIVRKLEPLLKKMVKKARDKYVKITSTMINERVAMDKDAKHDLYSFAVDHMVVGNNLGDSELWAEAFFFIVAGGNTTAATMAAMFFYLSRNPEAYKRLSEELRSAFADESEIRPGDKLRNCIYMQACIDETLRLATPNTGTLWRQQNPADDSKEPLVIDGNVVPKGTHIGVNLYAIHHNPQYFPDPFSFRPERWLEKETSPEQLQIQKNAFAPFILGTRSCPGKAVAYMELNLAFARTFWNFDFEIAPGDQGKVGAGEPDRKDGRHRENEYQLYDTFSAMHKGPILRFHARR